MPIVWKNLWRPGERCPTSKLTDSLVYVIRRRADCGESVVSIAEDMPVSCGTVARVARRAAWRHLPEVK